MQHLLQSCLCYCVRRSHVSTLISLSLALSPSVTDKIITARVDLFCILCVFSLQACLFDLSLITSQARSAFLLMFPFLFAFLNHLPSQSTSVFSCPAVTCLPHSKCISFCLPPPCTLSLCLAFFFPSLLHLIQGNQNFALWSVP